MDIVIWKELVKNLEKMKKDAYNRKIDRIVPNKEKTGYLFKHKEVCNHCKTTKLMFVKIMFEKSQRLSYFHIDLIISVFMLGKKPYSYGKYHNRNDGKRFIENIKNIEKVNC